MEKNQLDEMMLESVAKTIENMAFTEILPSEFEMVETGKEYAVALRVLEPCVGSFQMIISQELLSFIAEAMLARPGEEIEEKSLLDFLAELLNTIAGSFLSAALPGDRKFILDLPEHIPAGEGSGTEQTVRWDFSAEETVFVISASEELVEYLR